ncbi:c-type cytochrome [Pseudomonas protegens]|uniref:c-type cytochrome n=1 Tax=Pseudomonas protegens TaxID=380021 RepID=UPI000F47E8AE|nr:c-type cytochrome [Pseudomonas protegens]MDP9517703.1 c-type cytochrome [Pseudomonas protegens]ROL90623.1 cytochrome C [Pseudomonas protegens]ROL98160.1 cytochrome C [Pseudomonas protegens]ROM07948.1 cytochrome C [Pseudomonas protegens]ROM12019.1 cytochrome C [Pseudomonas protegens]
MPTVTPACSRPLRRPSCLLIRRALGLFLGLLLSACGEAEPPAAVRLDAAPLDAARQSPADPALAQVYASSCQLCHANPASGAPLAGDAKAWAPRLAQGAETLLDHSINGYQGMPPMGLCMQCSEAQFLALISFMSGHSFQ